MKGVHLHVSRPKWVQEALDLFSFLSDHQDKEVKFILNDLAIYSGILTKSIWSADKKTVLMTFLMDSDTHMVVRKSEAKLYGYDLEEPSIGD